MAALAHPTADDQGSLERLVPKFFKFASVADGDTFSCPMADVKIAVFCPNHSDVVTNAVGIGASTAGITELTFQVGATAPGTLIVWGTGA
jgi:hypothetical protein